MSQITRILALSLFLLVTSSFSDGDCFNRYKAKIISVYDGDTVTAEIDLGIETQRTERVRLYGIDTPELRGDERPQGLISRDSLRSWVLGQEVIIETIKNDKRGKYGRLIGTLYKDGVNLNELLVSKGLAEEADY